MQIEEYKNDIKDLPLWLKYVVAGATIFATFFGGWGVYLVLTKTPIPPNQTISKDATNTINIAELFSKALSLDTVIERQDFLKKYVNSEVYGQGMVKEISRYGVDKFLVDITIKGQTISCPQDSNMENEKKLLLLQGKNVNFSGIFTFEQYFEHGLIINNCVLQN